ncbi:MAG: carbamoyltransferase C-terminal domain-containing protein, partial [Pyrinomonadaceae bacterium]
ADGVGDDISITFSKGKGSSIHRLEAFFYPNSFGQFYTACTQILGFKAGRHEGKITGLSGYGKPNEELLQRVEQTFFAEDGFRLNKHYYSEGFMRPRRSTWKALAQKKFHIYAMEYRNYKKPLKRSLAGYSREDIAYAFQHLLEREMVRLARRHVNGGPVHLALAGGVFANVKLNMALSQALRPDSIYIFPNMGDGGLCVGAALSVSAPEPVPARGMYLGTEYAEEEILKALAKHPTLTYTKPGDMAHAVAGALADKKIVARFDGRMEFGPRALGNRSILYHCGDRSVNDWLNQQLNRTEFMPFAPMCVYEDAEEYFDIREGEKRSCEFMTLVVKCTEKMTRECPAAVHVDGTARPQLLRREENPGMYDILTAYRELTGLSCVINTSFNMHEEPIVRSPEEAISAFQQSKLDHLVLGPFLVSQN